MINTNIFKFKLDICIVNLCRYKDIVIQAPSEVVSSFYTLKDLMVFFDQFHNEQYQSALRVSNSLMESKSKCIIYRKVYFIVQKKDLNNAIYFFFRQLQIRRCCLFM